MSRKYNYEYNSSSKKSNTKLIVLIAVLVVLIIAAFVMILNGDAVKNKLISMMGLETQEDNNANLSDEEENNNQLTEDNDQEEQNNNNTNVNDDTNNEQNTQENNSENNTSDQNTSNTDNLEWYEKELEYTSASKNYDNLKTELEDYIFNFTGQYGVYFVDLTSGDRFGINAMDQYQAASTIKIPLNLYIYSKAAIEGLDMNRELEYLEEDSEGGTGYIVNHGSVGDKYTIRTLCKYSIIYSDNIATNILLREFTREDLRVFMKKIGGQVVPDDRNVSCPRDMALYLEKLYLFTEQYPDFGNEIFSYLSRTHRMESGYVNTPQADERLVALLPDSLKVAHKIGNYSGAWHDVGLVFLDNNPYIIAVMTYGVLHDEVNDVIANISKKAYDFVQTVEAY